MSTINFTAVPYPAQKKIADLLTPCEMVKLAINTNDNVFGVLVFLNFRFKNTRFEVNMEKRTMEVRFPDGGMDFRIVFRKEEEAPIASPNTITIRTTSHGTGMLNVLRRIRQLFSGSIGQLTVDLRSVDESTLSKLEGAECEELVVVGAPRKVRKERVSEILHTVRARKGCVVESDLGRHLRLPLETSENLTVKFSGGVTLSELLKISCRKVELQESQLTAGDVNKYLHCWLNDSDATTEWLTIGREDEEDWSMRQVLRGVSTERYGVVRRDRQFVTARSSTGLPTAVLNMANGLDILRADGLLATVSCSGPVLSFCVWHKRLEMESLAAELTLESLKVEERRLQLVISEQEMQQRILENAGTIEEKRKTIEENEKSDANDGLAAFLKSLKEDIVDLVAENQKIQEDVKATTLEIEKTSEELKKVLTDLGHILLML